MEVFDVVAGVVWCWCWLASFFCCIFLWFLLLTLFFFSFRFRIIVIYFVSIRFSEAIRSLYEGWVSCPVRCIEDVAKLYIRKQFQLDQFKIHRGVVDGIRCEFFSLSERCVYLQEDK